MNKNIIIPALIAFFICFYFFLKENNRRATKNIYELQKVGNNTLRNVIPAEPLLGYSSYRELLQNQLIYPEAALKDSIQGVVNIDITIRKDGTPSINDVFDFGYDSKKEVERLIYEVGGKWNPAIDKDNGDTLEQSIYFSIPFIIRTNE